MRLHHSPLLFVDFKMNFIDSDLESELSKGLKEVEALLSEHIKGEYPLVVETSRHLVEAGGKRFRPMLTLISSHFGTGQNQRVIEAAVVCELTHVATLYHDDVMDEATLRRSVESANSRWGNTVAILTGDYLFSKASDLLADLGPEAVRLQAKTFERLVVGQIEETQGPKEGTDPLSHYLRVVGEKTGIQIMPIRHFGETGGEANRPTRAHARERTNRFNRRITVDPDERGIRRLGQVTDRGMNRQPTNLAALRVHKPDLARKLSLPQLPQNRPAPRPAANDRNGFGPQ